MTPFIVRPDEYRQFGERSPQFCLVTEAGNTDDFVLGPSSEYLKTSVLGLEPGEGLESLLAERCPECADILVVCTDSFLTSPPASVVGQGRKIVVMPCGSTPTTREHVSYFLGVVERTDVEQLERRCVALTSAINQADSVTLTDVVHGTEATLDPWGDYEWNQQAGFLTGGDQQVAPPGKFSALPASVMEFDRSRRLALTGTVALKGAPIVHRTDQVDQLEPQARLFARLDVLRRAPVVLELVDGLVSQVHPTNSQSWAAAEAINELMCRDEHYRIVWEFGIGLNEVMEPVAGNCGMNEMYGRNGGVLHLGFGLTPITRFALAFLCPGTSVRAGDAVLAPAGSGRRLNRRKAPSCGCS